MQYPVLLTARNRKNIALTQRKIMNNIWYTLIISSKSHINLVPYSHKKIGCLPSW